jgi:hypothetical protein
MVLLQLYRLLVITMELPKLMQLQCDRLEPACVNCVRSGWQCPGYPPKFEFQEVTISSAASGRSKSKSASPKSKSRSDEMVKEA